ncbi:MAG TPA: hypothetical protein VHW01_07160, partial [Polyangiaceae bacterium]|nr:hypothetical protein [Polyangiaceae bacterium]
MESLSFMNVIQVEPCASSSSRGVRIWASALAMGVGVLLLLSGCGGPPDVSKVNPGTAGDSAQGGSDAGDVGGGGPMLNFGGNGNGNGN